MMGHFVILNYIAIFTKNGHIVIDLHQHCESSVLKLKMERKLLAWPRTVCIGGEIRDDHNTLLSVFFRSEDYGVSNKAVIVECLELCQGRTLGPSGDSKNTIA